MPTPAIRWTAHNRAYSIMTKYVFLTGHRKSGTTLLRSLFDGHDSATTYPSDIGLFYAYFPCFTRDSSRSQQELRDRISLVLRRSLTSLTPVDYDGPTIDIDRFLELFWKHIARGDLLKRSSVLDALGKAWCDFDGIDPEQATIVFKETSQSVFFGELREDFPSLKMIQLIRDPRDNYAALKAGVASYYARLGEGEMETLASLINRCRMDMIAARVNSELHSDSFFVIRFEDLVADPREALGRTCAFLGWPFKDTMLAPTVMGNPTVGNSHSGTRFRQIDSSHVAAWRERISPEEAKIIEYWCEREMRDWGYEPVFSARDGKRRSPHSTSGTIAATSSPTRLKKRERDAWRVG